MNIRGHQRHRDSAKSSAPNEQAAEEGQLQDQRLSDSNVYGVCTTRDDAHDWTARAARTTRSVGWRAVNPPCAVRPSPEVALTATAE